MYKEFFLTFLWISTCLSQKTVQSLYPRNPNNDCACVNAYLCVDNKILTTGANLLGTRIDLESEFIPNQDPNLPQCNDPFRICCNKPDYFETEHVTTGQRYNEDDFTRSPLKDTPKPNQTLICGERTESFVLLRVKGSDDDILFEAEFGEFPWTMALFKRNPTDSNDLRFLCGAALLSPRIAITVAHNIRRIRDISTLVLRAGEFDMSSTKENIQHQDRTIQKIIKHPDYYSVSHINDLAILTWEKPLDMDNANIGVICLPDKDEIFDNQDCIATGWGKSIESTSVPYADIMKLIELKVVERNQCVDIIRNTKVGKRFVLDESFICAGGEPGKDTCKGDGGSPLVCKKNGDSFYKLAGLVSLGLGCGQAVPALYANIAHLSEWLIREMSKID